MERPMSAEIFAFHAKDEAQNAIRVLVADDDADTVLTLCTLLADEGFEVRALRNGDGVEKTVASFQPEVCILDIEMPGQDGYALARELSGLPVHERPMLIAITGVWIKPSDRFLAIMVGFDHFFQKPADPTELVAVLRARDRVAPASLQQRLHLARQR
jgi:DNA-binding response OmpR family regulator